MNGKMVVVVNNFYSGGEIIPYTNAVCKWCGKPFFKDANKTCYCSDECRKNAVREQKAEYQRKRRRLIKSGALVSMESVDLGTGYLGKYRKEDFDDEHEAVLKEMRRLKIKRRT